MNALIWDGAYFLPRLSTQASPLSPVTILYGTRSMSFFTIGSVKRRPIRRLIAKNVFSGLVTAWRLAACPTRRSPESVNATIEGVVRMPSLFSITLAFLPSITATQEFVVPRSIPMTLLMDTSFQKQDQAARGSTVPIPQEVIFCHPLTVAGVYICGGASRYNGLAPQSALRHTRSLADRAGWLARLRAALGNPDHGGPQQPIMKHIAGLQHLDDRAARVVRPFGLEDRLVEIVIEALALGIDAPDPMPLENAQEFALRRRDPSEKAARAVILGLRLGQAFERAVQVICGREQVLGKAGDRISRRIFALALGAAAHILGLGERAQQAVLLLGELSLELDNSCLRRRFFRIRFDRSALRPADVVVSGLVGLGNLLLLVSDILHRLSYPIKRPIILAV